MISKLNLVWINILNTIFFVVCLGFNYFTVTGKLSKTSHKSEAEKHYSNFMPARYNFFKKN